MPSTIFSAFLLHQRDSWARVPGECASSSRGRQHPGSHPCRGLLPGPLAEQSQLTMLHYANRFYFVINVGVAFHFALV